MKKNIGIHIGEYYASKEPAVIQTILGSCVAVCLFDPTSGIGGMNHILLPGKADLTHFNTAARYGINAMELLINEIMKLGGQRHRLAAKVFGGAHVLQAISERNGTGRKNAAFAVEFLGKEGIKIICKDLGGGESRRIYFHTDTGEVFLKRISFSQQRKIIRKQESEIKRIRTEADTQGGITLFK
jgi:chemotaxis protein CheD